MNNIPAKTLTSALALGTLLLLGSAAGCTDDTSTQDQAIKCFGINDCKAMGECSSPQGMNDCQGKNDCKGMGWVSVETTDECTSKGGTVI